MKKIVVGLGSFVAPSFWGSSKDLFRTRHLPAMAALAERMDFTLAAWSEDIVSEADAESACRYFEEQGADFILLQCTTFPGGNVILPFGHCRARLGLWGLPEPERGGAIPLNSFCGINLLSSILGQYMDAAQPMKWFYGDSDDPKFLRRFSVTVAALRGIKSMTGARIGLLGGIAPGFTDFAFDERKTKAKLGITVDRLPEFGDIKERALTYDDAVIAPLRKEFSATACCVSAAAEHDLDATARCYKAIEDIIKENRYDAVGIGCWPRYRASFGIVACAIIGRLLEEGYIAACEGDVDSAASLLMLRGISRQTPMLMDLSDIDFCDNTALLWHCGSAPACFANKDGMKLDAHYKPGRRAPAADSALVGCVNDMVFAPGDITVARFTWEYERALLLAGSIVEKADTGFDGSRGWMGGIRVAGQHVDADTLVNTIMVSRFQHHYPVAAGCWEDEVLECLAWLGVDPIAPVPYRNYLQKF